MCREIILKDFKFFTCSREQHAFQQREKLSFTEADSNHHFPLPDIVCQLIKLTCQLVYAGLISWHTKSGRGKCQFKSTSVKESFFAGSKVDCFQLWINNYKVFHCIALNPEKK